jgi:RAB protein geranylgeranyltransferase component A
VDLLLDSGVSEYFSFNCVNIIAILNENKWIEIPLSKSEIFKSDILTLIEKRRLVRFIELCLGLYDKLTENANKSVNSTHVYEFMEVENLSQIEGKLL